MDYMERLSFVYIVFTCERREWPNTFTAAQTAHNFFI